MFLVGPVVRVTTHTTLSIVSFPLDAITSTVLLVVVVVFWIFEPKSPSCISAGGIYKSSVPQDDIGETQCDEETQEGFKRHPTRSLSTAVGLQFIEGSLQRYERQKANISWSVRGRP